MDLSVVIPVRDEARLLPGLLDALARQRDRAQVIVADGGSTDGSVAIARDHPLRPTVLVVAGGRWRQLDAALSQATGEYVLLLPADLRLAADALERWRRWLTTAAPRAGCLRRVASGRAWVFRWLDGWSVVRARWTRGAYMDQAPFFARGAALAAGGFRDLGSYDTADLGRRVGRSARFAVAPVRVVVSCRAYHRHGWLRTTIAHQRIRWRHLVSRWRGRTVHERLGFRRWCAAGAVVDAAGEAPGVHRRDAVSSHASIEFGGPRDAARHFIRTSAQTYPSGSATNASVPQS